MLDAVVVGVGLAGAAAAWQLARRDREVVIVEQFRPGHDRGSSHGTERIVRLGYTATEYVALVQAALVGWADLEAEAGQRLLHVTGALDHGYPDELQQLEAAYRACGAAYEWLGPDAAAERWPGLRFDADVLLQPDGGWIRADRALEAFLAGATHRGAELHVETPVRAIEPARSGVRVVTDRGSWEARVVVVAAGAWAGKLLAGLVDRPPLTVTDEHVAYFQRRDDAPPEHDWPCFIRRGTPFLYGLPGAGGRIKVGEHGSGPVVDPDRRSGDIDAAAVERLAGHVARWVPGVDPAPVEVVRCLYATAPNDDIVVDRIGPVVVVSGLGGHGFKFGPELGRLAAELVDLDIEARPGPGARANPFALARPPSGPGRSGAR